MRLTFDYAFKNVSVVDTDGIKREGYVEAFTPSADSDNGEPGIFFVTDKEQLYLSESDIKEIKILEENR